VYAAESLVCRIFDTADRTDTRTVELHGSTFTLPVERRFASVDSVQRYVDQVLGLAWVRATWPQRSASPVTVRPRGGQSKAHYERLTATIAIPPHARNRAWALRELVVLHELAHHLAADAEPAAHGAEFVDRLLTLVGEIVGPEAAFVLRAALHDDGVDLAARH
jgi:putative metallohydrolase (TIGR04338 family)